MFFGQFQLFLFYHFYLIFPLVSNLSMLIYYVYSDAVIRILQRSNSKLLMLMCFMCCELDFAVLLWWGDCPLDFFKLVSLIVIILCYPGIETKLYCVFVQSVDKRNAHLRLVWYSKWIERRSNACGWISAATTPHMCYMGLTYVTIPASCSNACRVQILFVACNT